MDDIRAFLSRKPLLFDGGMGTYYKAAPGTDCEQANLTDPAARYSAWTFRTPAGSVRFACSQSVPGAAL